MANKASSESVTDSTRVSVLARDVLQFRDLFDFETTNTKQKSLAVVTCLGLSDLVGSFVLSSATYFFANYAPFELNQYKLFFLALWLMVGSKSAPSMAFMLSQLSTVTLRVEMYLMKGAVCMFILQHFVFITQIVFLSTSSSEEDGHFEIVAMCSLIILSTSVIQAVLMMARSMNVASAGGGLVKRQIHSNDYNVPLKSTLFFNSRYSYGVWLVMAIITACCTSITNTRTREIVCIFLNAIVGGVVNLVTQAEFWVRYGKDTDLAKGRISKLAIKLIPITTTIPDLLILVYVKLMSALFGLLVPGVSIIAVYFIRILILLMYLPFCGVCCYFYVVYPTLALGILHRLT